jgi:hypothetical protein
MTNSNTPEAPPPEPSVIYDFDPNNLPPEYLQAIGLVAMASAQTESVIGDFIAALLGIDAIETLALTTHMVGPLKDHVVRALTELNAVSVEIVDQIDDLMDAINEAMNRRNVIVHNALIMHPTTGEILSHRLKARGSLQLELRPVSVEEIKQDASLIYEVGMALMGFMMAYGLGPRERKHAPRQPLDRSKKARAKRRDTAGVTR